MGRKLFCSNNPIVLLFYIIICVLGFLFRRFPLAFADMTKGLCNNAILRRETCGKMEILEWLHKTLKL